MNKVHVVGIGGAGMSAIAAILVALGHEVSGSDVKDSASLERLRALGVGVKIGHDAANVMAADLVAYSSAIAKNNVELACADASSIPIASRSDLLAAITRLKRTICVAGTHGKTTTTTMLGLILAEAKLDPAFIVGGDVNEIGTNAVWGSGEWLAVEADESDGTFLNLDCEIAVVTSVEADHLDHYGSFDDLVAAFRRFVANAKAGAVVFGDDPVCQTILPRQGKCVTYGFSESVDLRIVNFITARSSISFRLELRGEVLGDLELPVPGAHNALNAAAAIAAASFTGASIDHAKMALGRFAGVARRYEFRGESRGVTFIDDYAHLPGEVAATLKAARSGGFGRVVAVFQPHRYSRVQSLAGAFKDAFVDADLVVVSAIYPAGELARPGVSSKLIVDAISSAHPEARIAYLAHHDDVVSYLNSALRPGDCCVFLGAGDISGLADELLGDRL